MPRSSRRRDEEGTAQHDSLKTVKKTIKQDKKARKAGEGQGRHGDGQALKKQIKAEKKTKAALKAETRKTSKTKKPRPDGPKIRTGAGGRAQTERREAARRAASLYVAQLPRRDSNPRPGD